MMVYLWLVVLIVSLVAEAATAALIAVWFMPAALISLVLASFGAHIAIQIVVFVLISAFCLAFFAMKLRKNIIGSAERTNIDALIGADAIVEEDMGSGKSGRVKIKGQSWSAQTDAPRIVVKGETVKVLRIEGVRLICEPYEKNAAVNEEHIGREARVETEIDNYAGTGRILIDGQSFLAKSEGNGIIPAGSIVRIITVSGNKYVCSKAIHQ